MCGAWNCAESCVSHRLLWFPSPSCRAAGGICILSLMGTLRSSQKGKMTCSRLLRKIGASLFRCQLSWFLCGKCVDFTQKFSFPFSLRNPCGWEVTQVYRCPLSQNKCVWGGSSGFGFPGKDTYWIQASKRHKPTRMRTREETSVTQFGKLESRWMSGNQLSGRNIKDS